MSRTWITPSLVDHDLFVRICRSRDFLAACAYQPVLLEQAAREAYLSKFHFLRLFQDIFGETPHDFVMRLRMEEARRLLAGSDLSVTEICSEVGYESLGSFSVRFRQATGYSPSEFRRKTRSMVTVPSLPLSLWIPTCLLTFF